MLKASEQTKEAQLWGMRFAHTLLAGMQHGPPREGNLAHPMKLHTHTPLDPDIPLLGVNLRIYLEIFEKKYCSRICNSNILENTQTPMYRRLGSHPHNEVLCSSRNNKKDLHQQNRLRESEKQQRGEY